MKASFPPASRGERDIEVDKQGYVVALAAVDAPAPGVGGAVLDPSGDLDGEGGVDGQGARRSLLGFVEAQGNSSNFCIPFQYSEKKCGLRKLIYLVEGDPNTVDSVESVKTACFTTKILERFDVQRTTGYADTEKRYGCLTLSIIDYYRTNFSVGVDSSRVCMTYDEFVKRCSDLAKVTVCDIFALQLMQVPQATKEAVLAVTSLYPTLLSLSQAYSMLE